MKKLMGNQRGGVMILMVLAFMAFGSPVIIGTLRLSDSLATNSGVNTSLLRRDYCGLAISEYVRYLTLTQARWDGWWDANRTTAEGEVPAMGQEVITFGKCNATFNLQTSGSPGDPPAIPLSQLQTTKSVDLNSVTPGAVLEYQVVVSNPSTSLLPVDLTTIYDGLPLGFNYQTGTTLLVWPGGSLTDDPIQTFPGTDQDQYCIFESGTLTIAPSQIVNCSVGANGDVRLRNDSYIGGNVRSVNGDVDLDNGARVTGDIRAGGDVTLGQGVVVQGSIRADGNVTLGQGARVEGNIRAGTGDVTLGQGDVVLGDVVSMTGDVDISQGASLSGDIWAGDDVLLRNSAATNGNVWALDQVTLNNSATVANDVVAGGNVNDHPTSTVTGTITQNCQAPACTVPPVPAWALTDGSGDRLLLTWGLTNSGVTLKPGETATLTFRVLASSEVGNYCNQAWADPGATSTGMTAKAAVGSPSGTLCHGEEVVLKTTVDKEAVATGTQPTFTYTTTIQNNGLTNLTLTTFRSKLPSGFSYVVSSAKYLLLPSGTEVAAANPTTLVTAGRQSLTWFPQPFDTDALAAGVTRTLTFQATPDVALVKGNYRTESWAFFEEYDSDQTPYTWPTALVQALDPFQGTATDSDGKDLGSYEAWQGTPTAFFNWTIR